MERLGGYVIPIHIRSFRSGTTSHLDRLGGGIKDKNSPQLTLPEFTEKIFYELSSHYTIEEVPGCVITQDDMKGYLVGWLDDDLDAYYDTYTRHGYVSIYASRFFFMICDVHRGIKGAIRSQLQNILDGAGDICDIRFLIPLFNAEGIKELDKLSLLSLKDEFTVLPGDFEVRLQKIWRKAGDAISILIEHSIYGQDLLKLCEKVSYEGRIYGDDKCITFNI